MKSKISKVKSNLRKAEFARFPQILGVERGTAMTRCIRVTETKRRKSERAIEGVRDGGGLAAFKMRGCEDDEPPRRHLAKSNQSRRRIAIAAFLFIHFVYRAALKGSSQVV